MNNYDKELLKTTSNMHKGITVQATHLNGNQNASLSFDDVCKMTSFSLNLGCQISEANNSNRGKVIAEGVFGGTLILGFAALLVANFANRLSKDEDTSYQYPSVQLPTPDNGALEAKMAELERMYQPNSSVFINT